jgi:hypothetical protein
MGSRRPGGDDEPLPARQPSSLPAVPRRTQLSRSYARDLRAYAQVLSRLYRAIQRVSGSRVVVDSSIDPAYGFVLRHVRVWTSSDPLRPRQPGNRVVVDAQGGAHGRGRPSGLHAPVSPRHDGGAVVALSRPSAPPGPSRRAVASESGMRTSLRGHASRSGAPRSSWASLPVQISSSQGSGRERSSSPPTTPSRQPRPAPARRGTRAPRRRVEIRDATHARRLVTALRWPLLRRYGYIGGEQVAG